MKFKPTTLLTLTIFIFNFSYSQYKTETIKETKKSIVNWVKYEKLKAVLIEYSYQEDNPSRGYKGEYIVFRITNSSNNSKNISWDFTATFENGKCLNCNSDNSELHFESKIPSNSFIEGEINNYYKGPLVIFHHFTDLNVDSEDILKWKTFDLKNLIIK
tara:strand:+ start:131 stop:607 length:477 start_codon:yes stop_codon:yes gene_type:complete